MLGAKINQRECLEQLTQASAIAQQVAHNSEDPRTVRYAKGKYEGLQIALRLVREMEASNGVQG